MTSPTPTPKSELLEALRSLSLRAGLEYLTRTEIQDVIDLAERLPDTSEAHEPTEAERSLSFIDSDGNEHVARRVSVRRSGHVQDPSEEIEFEFDRIWLGSHDLVTTGMAIQFEGRLYRAFAATVYGNETDKRTTLSIRGPAPS